MSIPERRVAMNEPQRNLSLAEALDRMLERGVLAQGNLTIGLADVDLVFLDLRLLLGAVDTIWPDGAPTQSMIEPHLPPGPAAPPCGLCEPLGQASAPPGDPIQLARDERLASHLGRETGGSGRSTADGLLRLVLTLVRLLHDVLERQAVRRMEGGRLTDAQIDRLGAALFAQAQEIARLQRQFGFSERELSLQFGVPDSAL